MKHDAPPGVVGSTPNATTPAPKKAKVEPVIFDSEDAWLDHETGEKPDS